MRRAVPDLRNDFERAVQAAPWPAPMAAELSATADKSGAAPTVCPEGRRK